VNPARRINSITLQAPAKINLFLDVINKRKDGYHNIATIFQKISLHDIIKVKIIKKGISIDCRYPGVPANKANLACKAARLMMREFGLGKGVHIHIRKNIPPAAGLGGGSSDAASVIIAINQLFDLGLSRPRLSKIAKNIGADIPFFVHGYDCAIGRGIGERLKQVKHNRLWHVLILLPGLRLYTKTIYSCLSLPLTKTRHSVNIIAHALKDKRRSKDLSKFLYNRLEDAVLPQYPVVRQAKEILSLYNTKGILLSGSGPAVFALFDKRKEAMRARERIGKEGRWQLFLTKTV
jgi:4-diphosphocytidyl-2-C-methyl-D-erythritol kinase